MSKERKKLVVVPYEIAITKSAIMCLSSVIDILTWNGYFHTQWHRAPAYLMRLLAYQEDTNTQQDLLTSRVAEKLYNGADEIGRIGETVDERAAVAKDIASSYPENEGYLDNYQD